MTELDNSANRQIARSAGTVMIALLFSNLINLASLTLNAATFGTQAEMDAFLAANRVAETLFLLMAGGALGSAFIPTFTGLLSREKREAAWRLASAIGNLVLIVLTLAAIITAIFAKPLVQHVLAPGFSDNPVQEALTVKLLLIMLPSVVLFGLSGLVMGILNSHQVFFIPALTPAMYRLGMIFGVLFLAPRMGIFGLAWGVLIGAAMHLLLQLPSLFRLKGIYFPTLGLKLPDVRQVGLLMVPRIFGVAVVQINFWVNINLASRMMEGSITGITWGLALMLMPQTIIAQSVAMAALPTLSAQFALNKIDDLRHSLASSLRGILLLAIPASLGLIMLRQPIVALLLEYGNFTEESTQLISWAVLWYAAGLLGHCIVEIIARAFYAMQNTRTPVIIGAIAMGLNILFSILFSTWFARLGWMPHGGLALANSLATGLEAVCLFLIMRHRLKGLEGTHIMKGSAQAILATMVMGLVLWIWLGVTVGQPVWLVGLGGVCVGGAAYGICVWLLRVPEAHTIVGMLKRRLRPSYK